MFKKEDLLFLLLLLLLQLRIGAQPALSPTAPTTCIRAIYRLSYKLDSTATIARNEQMILRITNGVSCFKSMPKHVRDSVFASLNDRPEQERFQESYNASGRAGKTKFFYSIFKEPAKSIVLYHDAIGTIDYQYQEKAPLFNWQITPVKNTIAGYDCQQAFTSFGGRVFEAWFTRAIPVSEGPYKFYGLPGLIVRLRDTHDNYVFELHSFEANPKPFTITTSSSSPLITKDKFKQAKLNDELTFMDRMASTGNKVPDDMRRNYAEEMKRRNNLLEQK